MSTEDSTFMFFTESSVDKIDLLWYAKVVSPILFGFVNAFINVTASHLGCPVYILVGKSGIILCPEKRILILGVTCNYFYQAACEELGQEDIPLS